MFYHNADGFGGVGGDGRVISDKWGFKAVKGMAICGKIVSRHCDDSQKVVLASGDVNELDEVGEEFENPLEIIVNQCSDDGWDLGSCICDDDLSILRHRHGNDREG